MPGTNYKMNHKRQTEVSSFFETHNLGKSQECTIFEKNLRRDFEMNEEKDVIVCYPANPTERSVVYRLAIHYNRVVTRDAPGLLRLYKARLY